MEAIKQRVKIPKSHEIPIKIPQYIPENEIAEIILLLNSESKKSKINKLTEAMKDPIFVNDLDEISEDFKETDKARWEGFHKAFLKIKSQRSAKLKVWQYF